MKRFSFIVLRNSAFGMAAQILIKVLSFGFSVLIVRRLGAGDFGQYSAVIAFGVTFSFISDLGLSPYAVREIARLRDKSDGLEQAEVMYGNIIRLRVILSVVTIVLLGFTAVVTHRPLYLIGAILLNGLGLLIYSVQGASDAVLSGFERLDISSGAKVFNQLTFVVVGAVVLLLGLGYYGLIVAGLLGVGVMAIVCWYGVRSLGVHPLPPRRQDWSGLLKASLPFGIITFALGLSYKFDTVLLSIYRGDLETGYYNAAYNLVFSAVIFSNVINTALYPSLTRQASSSPDHLPRIYERTLRYLMVIALPITVGVWALASQLVPFLYKADYMPAIPALQIVIWVVPLMFATEFLGYIVVIANQERIVARSVTLSTAFNILVNLFLVPRYGFHAAAIMTVATEAILVAQYVWTLRAQIAQINLKTGVALPLLAALTMGGVLLLVRSQVPLLSSITIGAAVYFVMLALLGVVGVEDLRFVRELRSAPDTASGQ